MSDVSSRDETNLSRPRFGEASESHEHLSHPGPSRERGDQSCSPEPPNNTSASPWAFLGFAHRVFGSLVSHRPATAFIAEGSWRRGQWGTLTLSLTLGTAPGHTAAWKGPFPLILGDSRVTSWPPLGLYLPAISVNLGASSCAYSLGCWQSAVLGQAHHCGTCFRRRPTQGRHRQVACMCGHGTKQLPKGLIQLLGMGAAAETQHSTFPFLLPAGGDAEVGSVQQGHLQS